MDKIYQPKITYLSFIPWLILVTLEIGGRIGVLGPTKVSWSILWPCLILFMFGLWRWFWISGIKKNPFPNIFFTVIVLLVMSYFSIDSYQYGIVGFFLIVPLISISVFLYGLKLKTYSERFLSSLFLGTHICLFVCILIKMWMDVFSKGGFEIYSYQSIAVSLKTGFFAFLYLSSYSFLISIIIPLFFIQKPKSKSPDILDSEIFDDK